MHDADRLLAKSAARRYNEQEGGTMHTTPTTRKKLDYLIRATGRAEAEIMGEAVEQGLDELYRKQVADAYLSGQIDRKKAVAELGADLVEELDYARKSIESDIEWGLRSA